MAAGAEEDEAAATDEADEDEDDEESEEAADGIVSGARSIRAILFGRSAACGDGCLAAVVFADCGDGIDADAGFTIADLDQAELGVIGVDADEFGVYRQPGAGAPTRQPGLEGVGGLDKNVLGHEFQSL